MLLNNDNILCLSTSDRQAVLIAYLQEHIAKAIGINASQLDVQQPLNHLGLDSLIAVKLRNRLRSDLEVDVPAVKFMKDSTVASLATIVIEQLINGNSESVSPEQLPILSQDEPKLAPIKINDGEWLEGEI
ncbi:hypothetical protein GTQ43_24780 [Nostoc sp. KVJ3]|uniref:acyl carrier protein n=1 Tax=Nostoc sp. KVJ3 TaxID=457945 RepID=UPI002238183C|nr:acyl carrier protein [Nostoc sp. KVJ3]MCW5316913.1 hypothetical protein [Nostoc sp. KVJ3]